MKRSFDFIECIPLELSSLIYVARYRRGSGVLSAVKIVAPFIGNRHHRDSVSKHKSDDWCAAIIADRKIE